MGNTVSPYKVLGNFDHKTYTGKWYEIYDGTGFTIGSYYRRKLRREIYDVREVRVLLELCTCLGK